ncbi:MAG: prepilin-type N-terminal cleavage/methylation domain-containing protein, partial [candidate division Zixibacteria bacterium]|nr:prepilin-type N-terminal cleavage/methylation domain-containing protein [candidate division Zixibacteria bacterium]
MREASRTAQFRLDERGFTLIEIVIIIVTLGILAAVAIPRFADIAASSRVTATKQELVSLKTAIV